MCFCLPPSDLLNQVTELLQVTNNTIDTVGHNCLSSQSSHILEPGN